MSVIKLFESPYKARAGGVVTKAITKALGTTTKSLTDVFLREAVQNSYDAKVENNKPLEIYLNCYQFKPQQAEYLSSILKASGIYGATLAKDINSDFYNVEIADRNSKGLTGKAGFNEGDSTDVEERFHHFIYMTGNDDIKSNIAGGSYGFGKAALYKFSKLRLIAVYTKVESSVVNDDNNSRFIICQIDERVLNNKGRVWWGQEAFYNDKTNYAGPLIGLKADEVAYKLGMKVFGAGETGTDILVLDVVDSNCAMDQEEHFTSELPIKLVHWFWPKMVTTNDAKKIKFYLFYNNKDITDWIPNPTEVYPYSVFARAFKRVGDYYSHKKGVTLGLNLYSVTMQRPKVDIGLVSLQRSPSLDFAYGKYIDTDWGVPVVALMRDVEFIVEYYKEGSISEGDLKDTRCFGVFHTDRLSHTVNQEPCEMERYFRDIENQTHDKWTHNDEMGSPNYLLKTMQTISQCIVKYLEVKTSLGNTASISAFVAQRLGAKLRFGFGSGASDPYEKEYAEKKDGTIKKSTFTKRAQTPEVNIENGTRVIKVYYNAKILEGKKLLLHFELRVLTNSPKEFYTPNSDEMEITLLTRVPDGREKTVEMFRANSGFFIVRKSGVYTISVAVHIDARFDIAVKKEEKDA